MILHILPTSDMLGFLQSEFEMPLDALAKLPATYLAPRQPDHQQGDDPTVQGCDLLETSRERRRAVLINPRRLAIEPERWCLSIACVQNDRLSGGGGRSPELDAGTAPAKGSAK